jgi:hypothetical protein
MEMGEIPYLYSEGILIATHWTDIAHFCRVCRNIFCRDWSNFTQEIPIRLPLSSGTRGRVYP